MWSDRLSDTSSVASSSASVAGASSAAGAGAGTGAARSSLASNDLLRRIQQDLQSVGSTTAAAGATAARPAETRPISAGPRAGGESDSMSVLSQRSAARSQSAGMGDAAAVAAAGTGAGANGGETADELDFPVVKFGMECSLRGFHGLYMTAQLVDLQPATAASSSLSSSSTATATTTATAAAAAAAAKPVQFFKKEGQVAYTLGVNGQGIGDPLDALVFVNIDKREDVGPIRYGMTVAIRAPAAKERLLGLKEGSKPGFYRNLAGQGEKWILLKGSPTSQGSEEAASRGKYVRSGDLLILQASASDTLLAVYEAVSGPEGRLLPRRSGALGGELWQLERFQAQPLPTWLRRPYLSHSFLLLPPTVRSNQPEAEARAFPGLIRGRAGGPVPGHYGLSPPVPPLSSFTARAQADLLLRELLLVLLGVEGQYIRVAAASPVGPKSSYSSYSSPLSLIIDLDAADKSTAQQVLTLLPMCESIYFIKDFVAAHSRYEYGLVSQAVASMLKTLMREFDVVISQLETLLASQRLTLSMMIFLLSPSRTTLRILHGLTRRLHNLSGGSMLDELYASFLEQGDSQAREIYNKIFQEASKPFLNMISKWLFRGELNDPYKEFMIQEDNSISKEALQEDFNAAYWESRYTLRESHIPRLIQPAAARALITGKYLNVVRGCLKHVVVEAGPGATLGHFHGAAGSTVSIASTAATTTVISAATAAASASTSNSGTAKQLAVSLRLPPARNMVFDLEDGLASFHRAVEEAYAFSSRSLLTLLKEDYELSSHLRSLRRFFLLEHGDFFNQFMDTAEDELRRDVKDVALSRVQNLLQLAVQTSTLVTDPHKEDLSCALASHNLIQHLHLIQSAGEAASELSGHPPSAISSQGLKGVEALTLNYRVGWPLSIVLSRRSITKYQLLSRLLYFSKHVERRVLSCWQLHQSTRDLNVRKDMGASYCLRHRMLHFLQNFVYYMTVEVIHPRSHEMEQAMVSAQDVDQVLALHERFLDSCLKECLLASQDLLKILTKLMTTCLLFADHMKKYMGDDELGSDSTSASGRTGTGTSASDQFISTLKKDPAARRAARRATRQKAILDEVRHESFIRTLSKFSATFDLQLKEFLDKLWTDSYRFHPQLSNLCVRLDYNGFYSSQFSSLENA